MWSAMPYEAQKMRTEDMQRKKSKGKLKEKDIEKLELMQKISEGWLFPFVFVR